MNLTKYQFGSYRKPGNWIGMIYYHVSSERREKFRWCDENIQHYSLKKLMHHHKEIKIQRRQ